MRDISISHLLPGNMSARPGFTSGRGAILDDLDSKRLDFIYDKILENIGESAAIHFVEMVQDLRVASCTGFLNRLYELANNNWKHVKKEEFYKTSDKHYENEGEALGTFLSSFGNRDRDQTLEIVGPFLRRFGKIHCTLQEQARENGGVYKDCWGNWIRISLN